MNRCVAGVALAAAATYSACATFTTFVVTSNVVSISDGYNTSFFRVYTVAARFNGPTDAILNCDNFRSLSGDAALAGFFHRDNVTGGGITQGSGTWNPASTGSTTNRAFDSYLTIGPEASAGVSISPDSEWTSGGNADARSWNRPDLPNNTFIGYYPNNGAVGPGSSPGLPSTDIRIGQFVVSTGDNTVRTFRMTLIYTNGAYGNVQTAISSFTLSPSCPTLYLDSDGDGFGNPNPNLAIVNCSAVPGYVLNNLDCNDSDAAINPNTVWFRDIDGDGFGASSSGATITQCTQPTGYSRLNTDCNDGNAAISPNTVWYRDLDGDGYGSSVGGTTTQCTQPTGFALSNTDCNDGDSAINPATVWHRDADGDGYGAATGATITQCLQPAGYVLSANDCNDGNTSINPNTPWYRDTDGDGRGVAADGIVRQCTQPTGYSGINGDNCPSIANADQADSNYNTVGDVCEYARGDLNLDGIVNSSDVPLLLNVWGTSSATPIIGDLNRDGLVNGADFALLLGHWGSFP